jgi:hypothetical protein
MPVTVSVPEGQFSQTLSTLRVAFSSVLVRGGDWPHKHWSRCGLSPPEHHSSRNRIILSCRLCNIQGACRSGERTSKHVKSLRHEVFLWHPGRDTLLKYACVCTSLPGRYKAPGLYDLLKESNSRFPLRTNPGRRSNCQLHISNCHRNTSTPL